MKKFTKVVGVILIISAMLMATFMPTFAFTHEESVAYYWITSELYDASDNIYKVTMHLDANAPVAVGDLRVYWPKDEFTLLEAEEPDPEWPCEEGSMAFAYPEGSSFADNTRYRTGVTYGSSAYGPAKSTLTAMYPVTAKFFNDAVPQSEYDAVQLAWIGGTTNHFFYDSSRWGDKVAEFYLLQEDGGDIANVQVKSDAVRYEIAYCNNLETGLPCAEQAGANAIPKIFAQVILTAPQAEATSILNHWKPQIRFQKTDDGKYAEKFDFRTLATITKADFDATFASEEEAMTAIKRVGFIYAKTSEVDTIDLAKVKEYVEGGNYVSADSADKSISGTKYVDASLGKITTGFSGAGDDYVISCLIKNIPDAQNTNGIHAVGYMVYEKDGEMHYAYYTDVVTTPFSGLYNKYIGQVRAW